VEAEDRDLTHEASLRVALALTRFGLLKAERLAIRYGFIREEEEIDIEESEDVR
jgi:hypothetical protein